MVTRLYTLYRAATTGFAAIAYEYAVEMTYPLPEGTSAGLVNVSSQVLISGQPPVVSMNIL